MKMKLSPGVQIALGLGALVVIYLIVKNNQAGPATVPPPGGGQLVPVSIPLQPISNAGLVAVDVQPPFVPVQITLN
jgi:hypothetical protein